MKKSLSIISVFMAMSIILTSMVFFTSCGSLVYRVGIFGAEWMERGEIKIGVTANTNKFDKDNITLDLYIGIYKTNFQISDLWGGSLSVYDSSNIYANSSIVFVAAKPFDWDTLLVDDYQNVDNLYCLKEVQCASLLEPNDYGYSFNRITGLKYNHKEKIKIPEELIVGNSGQFVVTFLDLHKPHENCDREYEFYYSPFNYYLTIDYLVEDNGRVVLEFDPYLSEWREIK